MPTGNGEPGGYFAFRRGQPFRHVEGPVPGDFEAGLRRAGTRLARLEKAAEAEADARPSFVTVVRNVGQTVFTEPLPLAA